MCGERQPGVMLTSILDDAEIIELPDRQLRKSSYVKVYSTAGQAEKSPRYAGFCISRRYSIARPRALHLRPSALDSIIT